MERRRTLRRHRRRSLSSGLLLAATGRARRGRRPPGSHPTLTLYLRTGVEADTAALCQLSGYDGVAYGAEFCAWRLPTIQDAVSVARACAASGKGFTLVTPVVREGALLRVVAYLEAIADAVPGAEWVCNDWGLLYRSRELKLPLKPTAGRLLSRQRRGPRVLRLIGDSSSDEVRALRGSVWDDPYNVALLQEMGIARVELDFLLQGTGRPNLPDHIPLTLCAPWIPVTFTPACEYTDDPLRCGRGCLAHPAVRRVNEQDPYTLWSRGNTQFVRSELWAPYQAAAKLGAERLVWAETLPG